MRSESSSIRAGGRGRLLYLFVALVLLVVVHPFFEASPARRPVLLLAALAIPIAGVYAVSDRRRNLVVAAVLCVPGILGSIQVLAGIPILPGGIVTVVVSLGSVLLFYAFTLAVVVAHVLSRETISGDTLFGAAAVYLLLGLTWMLACMLLEAVQPGSFNIPTQNPNFADFLYYSFVTLTTLGYGDITPATARARSLALMEAVTGVLYIAFLVARLVSLYGGPSSSGAAQGGERGLHPD